MILRVLLTIYSAIALAVQLVEDSKDGLTPEEAKAAALAHAKQIITGALGTFPAWLPEFILGYLIDTIVNILNAKGVFQHKPAEPVEPTPSAAADLSSYLNRP